MLSRVSNIVTLFLLASLGLMLALPLDQPWVKALFFAVVLALVFHLLFQVSRQRRRARAVSRLSGGSRRFMIDTAAHLDWAELASNFDEITARLLRSLANQGQQDGRALKPSLEKAFARLKRLSGRFPDDPGPNAYAAWCLALLSRINGREKAFEPGLEVPENRMWTMALRLREQALALAPNQGSILLDWGRILEGRAEASGGRRASAELLNRALSQYDQAVLADPELKEAWRGRGRVLGRLAMLPDPGEPDLDHLGRAVESFETARRDRTWPGDFYDEFGRVVFNLAQHHPTQGGHYFRYASRLFILAAELGGRSGSAYHAGRSLYEAGLLSEDQNPGQADELYQKALDLFSQSAEADSRDALSLLWSARCLAARCPLMLGENRVPVDGRDHQEIRAILEQADSLCSRASLIDPSDEIFSEWANVFTIQAELGGPRAGDFWAEAAGKFALAAACPEVPPGREAVIWHNWGFALASLAEFRPSVSSRRELLREAVCKYESAARVNGDNAVTLKNWGDSLAELAALSAEPQDLSRRAEEAEEVFRRASELYPSEAWPWRNWGLIVQWLARMELDPARRSELWMKAAAKMEDGVRANPRNAETWIMWGRVLSEFCREEPESERPRLIKSIIDIYDQALSLEPGDADTWRRLGLARLEMSEMADDPDIAGGPLGAASAAAESFKQACVLNPELALHWAEWGRALFRVSEVVGNEASALAALREAHEKYATAVALNPNEGEHHTGLGHVLYQWAWRLEKVEQKRAKFQKAYKHCAEARRLSPHDPNVCRNWGKVAEALANIEKDPKKSFAWQNEAAEKYYLADALEPPQFRGRRH